MISPVEYFTKASSVYGNQVKRPSSTNEVVCYNCCGNGWVPKTNDETTNCLQCGGKGSFPFGQPKDGYFRNMVPLWIDKNTLRAFQLRIKKDKNDQGYKTDMENQEYWKQVQKPGE
jgi:hypothetical protein